jgi:hypothetical protein
MPRSRWLLERDRSAPQRAGRRSGSAPVALGLVCLCLSSCRPQPKAVTLERSTPTAQQRSVPARSNSLSIPSNVALAPTSVASDVLGALSSQAASPFHLVVKGGDQLLPVGGKMFVGKAHWVFAESDGDRVVVSNRFEPLHGCLPLYGPYGNWPDNLWVVSAGRFYRYGGDGWRYVDRVDETHWDMRWATPLPLPDGGVVVPAKDRLGGAGPRGYRLFRVGAPGKPVPVPERASAQARQKFGCKTRLDEPLAMTVSRSGSVYVLGSGCDERGEDPFALIEIWSGPHWKEHRLVELPRPLRGDPSGPIEIVPDRGSDEAIWLAGAAYGSQRPGESIHNRPRYCYLARYDGAAWSVVEGPSQEPVARLSSCSDGSLLANSIGLWRRAPTGEWTRMGLPQGEVGGTVVCETAEDIWLFGRNGIYRTGGLAQEVELRARYQDIRQQPCPGPKVPLEPFGD